MKEKMICVEWDDASFNSGYYDKNDTVSFRQIKVRTLGHLIKRTGKEVILATERFYCANGRPDGERHISTIPRNMIKKITYLREE